MLAMAPSKEWSFDDAGPDVGNVTPKFLSPRPSLSDRRSMGYGTSSRRGSLGQSPLNPRVSSSGMQVGPVASVHSVVFTHIVVSLSLQILDI